MAQGPSGWVRFASIVLIFAGTMRLPDSIWAFRFNGSLPDNLNGGTLGSNRTTYAVVYIVVGALLIVTGIYVVMRSRFFRWVGVAAGIIGGLSGAVWLPYSPVWSLVYVAMAVLVVYGLIAHFEPAGTAAPLQGTPGS